MVIRGVLSVREPRNCAQRVLNAFSSARRHRELDLNPFDADQNAFDVAARTYREHNPELREEEVRRAVANIICRAL